MLNVFTYKLVILIENEQMKFIKYKLTNSRVFQPNIGCIV